MSHSTDLTLDILVSVVNSFNTKTHSSKEITEFCFGNADFIIACLLLA